MIYIYRYIYIYICTYHTIENRGVCSPRSPRIMELEQNTLASTGMFGGQPHRWLGGKLGPDFVPQIYSENLKHYIYIYYYILDKIYTWILVGLLNFCLQRKILICDLESVPANLNRFLQFRPSIEGLKGDQHVTLLVHEWERTKSLIDINPQTWNGCCTKTIDRCKR